MEKRHQRKFDRQEVGPSLQTPLPTGGYSRYYRHAPNGAMVVDTDGVIIYANPAFTTLSGHDERELAGAPLSRIGLTLAGEPCADHLLGLLKEEGKWEGNLTIHRHGGGDIPVRLVATPQSHHEGPVTEYVLFVSPRHAEERQDKLTGLPDRVEFLSLLDKTIQTSLEEKVPLAIFLVNLDRFRDVNDTLGYTVGDELLNAVARRLSAQLRGGDAVARLGGDEFLLFVHLVEEASEAAAVAQRLLRAFSSPLQVGEREMFVSITCGITVYPADGDSIEGTLRRAHMALADAKRHESGNYRFYSPEMEQQVVIRHEIENNLMPGLERGEFTVYYQPKISTTNGRIVGMEALIRWNSPIMGQVPPALFIPLAEERGFVAPLGAWVLKQAAVQAKKWHDQGFVKMVVSVNLSGRQLANREIVDTVIETLKETGLPPELLELEVTETAVMADITHSLSTLNELSALGVNLSLDDFGSGYSSLSYLNRLPVNRIKIDREFVKEVGLTTDDSVIARATIAMGHTMGLTVIAEGAETGKQVSFLHANGCDEIQGYFYSPPVPAEDLNELLSRSNPGERKSH